MEETKPKKNIFLSLLGGAAKSITACLVALFLIGLLDGVSSRKEDLTKKKLRKSAKASDPSIEEKVEKWR